MCISSNLVLRNSRIFILVPGGIYTKMCILMNDSAVILKFIRDYMNISQPNHYFFVKPLYCYVYGRIMIHKLLKRLVTEISTTERYRILERGKGDFL